MKEKKIVITVVHPGSIAEEAGIEPGDGLLSINGEAVRDIFDYRFLVVNEFLELEVEKKDGEVWEIEIEKDEYEDLGLDFESSMMDEAKNCSNQCVFCFIDQLPKGMRETMYFKDDDSRLSFLMGNYITLTNMKDDDIDRIIRYKMSPINISVHTTNPGLRVKMLNNRFAGDIMDKIRKLVAGGITVNCQIVLCRELNDGVELERTVNDLVHLYPGVRSVSVVPVGLTRYRAGLYALKAFDRESSSQVIDQVITWQERLRKKVGSRVVFLADEFYIMAERQLPEHEQYEDFPQIENGVGLIAQLRSEFDAYVKTLDVGSLALRNVSIATGMLSYQYLKEMADQLEHRFPVKVKVYAIKNTFFGETVTVTGLLTGQDLVGQLKDQDLGEELLLCRCMLKAGEEVFLDDYTVSQVAKRLNTKITVVNNQGAELADKILGLNK